MKIVLTQPIKRFEDIDQNFEMIIYTASQSEETLEGAEMLVLPELVGAISSVEKYENWVKTTAKTLKCIVVGGSHHEQRENGVFNCGAVANPDGDIIAHYDKLRPYGSEFNQGVLGGNTWGQFNLNGRQFVILICSDLWYSSFFHQFETAPDVVFTPSFSVTQRPKPIAGQNLWQFMAVSRAYEFSTYVGVSDWAHPCEYHGLYSCGVSGLADPSPDDECFFIPVGDKMFRSYELDFDRLDELRENRKARNFLWQY